MKKIGLGLLFAWILVAVIYPKYPPMFEGMIMRCDSKGACHWECEYGVVTSTTIVNQNMVLKSVGCEDKKYNNGIYVSPSYYRGI